MSQRTTCLLHCPEVHRAMARLLDHLEPERIEDSLRACLRNSCDLERNTLVNLHGQLQSLHYILDRLMGDMESVPGRQIETQGSPREAPSQNAAPMSRAPR